MKTASGATIAILASRQFLKAELYAFTLLTGTTYYFTDADIPLTVASITYLRGLSFVREATRQKIGLEVQTMDITVASDGSVLIAGVPFLQAVRQGAFDGATVKHYKIFLSSWTDTSPGAVLWFQGRVNQAQAGRMTARLTLNAALELLDTQMPRNTVQPGCLHSLFDAGCTLSRATFAVNATVSGNYGANTASFNSSLVNAAGYFALGKLLFTSGANAGVTRTVQGNTGASGNVTVVPPLPAALANGDAFTIYPGCDKQQATCSGKFANLVHFRGAPYVPVPETLYSGGAEGTPAPASGQSGIPPGGSPGSGGRAPGSYKVT